MRYKVSPLWTRMRSCTSVSILVRSCWDMPTGRHSCPIAQVEQRGDISVIGMEVSNWNLQEWMRGRDPVILPCDVMRQGVRFAIWCVN
ncbi:hypothetical protein D9M68_603960 [compost metagenome]